MVVVVFPETCVVDYSDEMISVSLPNATGELEFKFMKGHGKIAPAIDLLAGTPLASPNDIAYIEEPTYPVKIYFIAKENIIYESFDAPPQTPSKHPFFQRKGVTADNIRFTTQEGIQVHSFIHPAFNFVARFDEADVQECVIKFSFSLFQ